MGNNIYPKNSPKLTNCSLMNLKTIPLKELTKKSQKVKQVCVSTKLSCVFIVFKGSKKILKYDLSSKTITHVYKKQTNKVQHIFLNNSQTRLYTCDGSRIYIYDCGTDKFKRILHDYYDRTISCFRSLEGRFLAVALQDNKGFDIFDLRTEIKESLIYSKSPLTIHYSFKAFISSTSLELMGVLDHENLFIFRLTKLRQVSRKHHNGSTTQLLHMTADDKFIFTLNKGYINVLKTGSLEKAATLKFRKFRPDQWLRLTANGRLLLVCEDVGAVRLVDLRSFETVCQLKQEEINRLFLTTEDRIAVATQFTLVLFKIEAIFAGNLKKQKKSQNNIALNSGRLNSGRNKRADFTENYKKIDFLVRRGEVDEALIECRRIIRKDKEAHKAYFLTGKLLLTKQSFEDGVEFIDKAIFLSKHTIPDYFIWRGKALFYFGRYREAVESFNKALILDPEKKSAKINLKLTREKLEEAEGSVVITPTIDFPRISKLNQSLISNDFDFENKFVKAFENDLKSNNSKIHLSNFKRKSLRTKDKNELQKKSTLEKGKEDKAFLLESSIHTDKNIEFNKEDEKFLEEKKFSYANFISSDDDKEENNKISEENTSPNTKLTNDYNKIGNDDKSIRLDIKENKDSTNIEKKTILSTTD